jgi:hypothetical protein
LALVVHADSIFAEHLTPPEHPERPERVLAVLSGLQGSAHVARVLDATVGDLADVKRVHDPAYVEHIRGMAEAGGGALDPDTWISNRSFDVALRATGTICKAVDLCLDASGRDPARRAFCVLRPPGHHARPAGGMGFCLFNNVAVAAARARLVHSLERVAIVDFLNDRPGFGVVDEVDPPKPGLAFRPREARHMRPSRVASAQRRTKARPHGRPARGASAASNPRAAGRSERQ